MRNKTGDLEEWGGTVMRDKAVWDAGRSEDVPLAGMPRILQDLADGRLTDIEAGAVVQWLEASDEGQPPSWAVSRAARIGRQTAQGQRPRTAMWRHLVAALVYDTREQPRAAGARAVRVREDQLRLMYQAGGIEIDLEVDGSSIAGRLRMLGQVTAGEPDLIEAWVAAEGPSGRAEAEVDDLGQFVLDGLMTGRHRLQIGLAYELIEIPEVHI